MDCPVCRLTNPPGAELCDCGYDFVNKAKGRPIVTAHTARLNPAWRTMVFFTPYLLTLLGVVVFLISTVVASVMYSVYRREHPGVANDAMKWFSSGIAAMFLMSVLVYGASLVLNGPVQ